MEQKKGLSLVTSISIFAALLTLFVGDRLIERVVDGDEETRTKVLVGAVSAFAIVAVLSGFTYLYAVGPAGLLRVFLTLLILVLVSAFFWDVATTFLGVYSIIRPGATPAKAVAGAAIISAIIFTVLLGAGAIFDGQKPKFWVGLYVPLLLCVLGFDFWTSYRGTAYFLWNAPDPGAAPRPMGRAGSHCGFSVPRVDHPRRLGPPPPRLRWRGERPTRFLSCPKSERGQVSISEVERGQVSISSASSNRRLPSRDHRKRKRRGKGVRFRYAGRCRTKRQEWMLNQPPFFLRRPVAVCGRGCYGEISASAAAQGNGGRMWPRRRGPIGGSALKRAVAWRRRLMKRIGLTCIVVAVTCLMARADVPSKSAVKKLANELRDATIAAITRRSSIAPTPPP